MEHSQNTGVSIQNHQNFGKALFAVSPFAAGDIVLWELPLLVSAPESDRAVAALHAAAVRLAKASIFTDSRAVIPGDWLKVCAWIVGFLQAPCNVQHAVVHDMHTAVNPSSPLAAMAQLQADSIYRVAPAALPANLVCDSTGAPVSRDSIHKALLAYHLNAHDMQGVG